MISINIVHWKDVVGGDFMEKFTEISRDLILCNEKELPEETVLKKLSLEVRREYKTKRDIMRFCGWEDRERYWFKHGWYTAYLSKNMLQFHCTAEQERRRYITMGQFISWKTRYVESITEGGYDEFVPEIA